MKRIQFFLMFNFIVFLANGQKMHVPNASILTNTFYISTDTLSGSAFQIEYGNNVYVVSARHLFKSMTKNKEAIKFKLVNTENVENLNGIIYTHPNPSVDVVAIKIPKKVGDLKPYKINGDWVMGQDCYYLGYPYKEKFHSNIGEFRLPFIKKAIISAYYQNKYKQIMLLDGHNNPGFSGGPVVAYDYKNEEDIIIAVISGYYPQTNKSKIKNGMNDIPFEYSENSGIIISTPAKYVLDIIK